MRGVQKSKKVTWALDVNLRQKSLPNLPISTSPLVSSFDLPRPANLSGTSPAHISRTENGAASLAATSGGAFYVDPNGVGLAPSSKQGLVPGVCPVSPSPAMGLPQKDANYYKNLIQQHGGERQEQGPAQIFNSRYNQQLRPNQDLINNPNSRDSKPRIMKPCIYFNPNRGCRNGANCSYQQDMSSQNRDNNVSDTPYAKRMKIDKRDEQLEA